MEQSEFSYLKRNTNFVQTLLMSSKRQVIVKRYKDSVLYPSVRSCVKPTVHPLDSETGWSGEIWSKTISSNDKVKETAFFSQLFFKSFFLLLKTWLVFLRISELFSSNFFLGVYTFFWVPLWFFKNFSYVFIFGYLFEFLSDFQIFFSFKMGILGRHLHMVWDIFEQRPQNLFF